MDYKRIQREKEQQQIREKRERTEKEQAAAQVQGQPEKEKNKPTRRDALKKIGRFATGAATLYTMEGPLKYLIPDAKNLTETSPQQDPAPEQTDTPLTPEQIEAQKKAAFEKINFDTAAPVTAAFLKCIYDCAVDGASFAGKQVAALNALEILRLTVLRQYGGELGQKLADTESSDNLKSVALAIPLVALADLTSTVVKVDEKELSRLGVESLDSAPEPPLTRPTLEASPAEWETYLKETNKLFVEKVTEVQALTSITAPFLSTSTSPVLADQLTPRVLKLAYDQSYAKEVIRRKNQGESLDQEAIKDVAIERSNKCSRHFTNLETTLAANINGVVGFTTPTQTFGYVRHWGDWKGLAKSESFGAAFDGSMSAALPALFLYQYDALPSEGGEDSYLTSLKKAYEKMARVYASMTLGSVDQETENKLRAAVQASGMDPETAEKVMKSQKAVRVSVGDYARGKAEYAHRAGQVFGSKIKEFSQLASQQATTLLNPPDAAQQLSRFWSGQSTEWLEGNGTSEASKSAGRILMELTDASPKSERVEQLEKEQSEPRLEVLRKKLPEEMSETDQADVQRFSDSLKKILRLTQSLSRPSSSEAGIVAQAQQQQATQEGGVSTNDASSWNAVAEGIADAIQIDPDTVKKVFEGNLLSPQATDAAWQLAGQLPMTGPAAELAGILLRKTYELKGGAERSSRKDVLKAIRAAFGSEAILSSLADNLAAYIYAETLITELVQEVYGNDVLERFPSLNHAIFATTEKIGGAAGSLTKFGSATNNLLLKRELKKNTDPSATEEYTIETSEVPFEFYQNMYANMANGILMGGSLEWMDRELAAVEAVLDAEKAEREQAQSKAA